MKKIVLDDQNIFALQQLVASALYLTDHIARMDADDTSLRREINCILYKDWDPIGMHDCGCPSDEYSSYVPSILRLLKDGAAVDSISKKLQEIAAESIGLSTKEEKNMLVAKKLRALMDNTNADCRLGCKISAILFNDWDPIGMNDHGLLPDKYDNSFPSILHLLKDGANDQRIGMELEEIATEKMGLHRKATGRQKASSADHGPSAKHSR